LNLPAIEELSSLLQHVTISSQLFAQDENDGPPDRKRAVDWLVGCSSHQLKMILLVLLAY